ncbi:3'-5' exonuclease, putative [Bodo saltans]|uniref:3'-5' exonuclease, putative n=1 Tax=Bodo saltans TaxID=75058 RepID=A0A0S4JGY9_BODSA|nr:3'-5' exonuclease, putative [Bodo saltans]|eukprot:CUG89606.1 3'-5' exonuclease, putative [Bodo saltans]
MLRSCLLRCAAIVLPHSSSEATTTVAATTEVPVCSPDVLHLASAVLKQPYTVISSSIQLQQASERILQSKKVAVDVEACVTHDVGRPQLGQVSLIQLASETCDTVYLIDVLTLGKEVVVDALSPVLSDPAVEKQFFDCRRDVEAFFGQLGIVTKGAVDLQMLFTGSQWKLKSLNRRSSMSYVLKTVAGVSRQETDAAVQLAMTKGNRAVWDVRPLPTHFLEYAAGDVRHTLLLGQVMEHTYKDLLPAARRLTAEYTRHYSAPVEYEVDINPIEVSSEWLEMFFGPGGVCQYCRQPGHLEADCFRKAAGTVKCTHCGGMGHVAKSCYKRFPQKLKCEGCGQLGHTIDRCFKKNPCKVCGGSHSTENCRQRKP